MSQNPLKALDPKIYLLAKLEQLAIAGTHIRKLPKEIVRLE